MNRDTKELRSMDDEVLLKRAEGLFVHDQIKESLPLFEKLARHGVARAFYFLGECCRHGWGGVREDSVKGFGYHQRGAELGEALCQFNLAYDGKRAGLERQRLREEASPKIREMAEQGDVIAQTEWGSILSSRLEKKEGLEWIRAAARCRYWLAMEQLVVYLRRKQPEEAIDLCRMLVDMKGEHAGEAACLMGHVYFDQEDYDLAFHWYKVSADTGYPQAFYDIGTCFEKGYGVKKDIETAMQWFERACESGGKEAAGQVANRLGIIHFHERNYEEAVKWFRQGAALDEDEALLNLGDCFYLGKGIPKNIEEAKKLYVRVLEKQEICAGEAANRLGCIALEEGDDKDAAEWFQFGADNGSSSAMRHLARCCREGKGLEVDEKKAQEYERLARKGWDQELVWLKEILAQPKMFI